MADKSSRSEKLDPDDPATRQEVADAIGTKPDDPAVTKWINEHNSDPRVLFAEGTAEGQDAPAPAEPVAPVPVGETSYDPFTGEPYTIPPVEVGVLSSKDEQELRNIQEIEDMTRQGITRESFSDPNGITTPVREVTSGKWTYKTSEVVYPDHRVVTIQDRVDENGDGTRSERLNDFANDLGGVRTTPLEGGVPSGPPVVSGGDDGTRNFGPSTDDRASTVADLIDNSDVLDAIRPGGPTTDAGQALLDQFPSLGGDGETSTTPNQTGVNSPGSATTPTQSTPSQSNPATTESPIDRGDPYSPSNPSTGTSNTASTSTPQPDPGMPDDGAGTPSQPEAGSDGPGVAKILSDTTSADGTRQVVWMDGDGNTWANDGTNPTSFVGRQVEGQITPDDTPPATAPPPVPPPAPPQEEEPEEEEPEEEEEEEDEEDDDEEDDDDEEQEDEEEDDEEDEGMYDPDAGGSSGGVGVVGVGSLVPDYGSSTGAGTTNFGRGDIGPAEITGEVRGTNTAGPDVNPDADPTGIDLVTGGVLQPDYGSSTGAGTTNFGGGDIGPAEIGPPLDDGINPYADTDQAETFGSRGASEFDAQISGVEQLQGAALDVSAQTVDFDSSDFNADEAAAQEQQQPDGLGGPDPFEG